MRPKNIATLAFGPSTRDTGRGALILRARCLCWARPRLVSPLESPFRAQRWCCTAAFWAALLQWAAPAAHAGPDAYAFAASCLRHCLAHSTGAHPRFTATLPALPAAEGGLSSFESLPTPSMAASGRLLRHRSACRCARRLGVAQSPAHTTATSCRPSSIVDIPQQWSFALHRTLVTAAGEAPLVAQQPPRVGVRLPVAARRRDHLFGGLTSS